MADYGFKISKPGFDVLTASIKDLIMTSKANQYKIHLKGTVNFTGAGTQNVAHGLAYTPAFIAFYKSNSVSYYRYAGTLAIVDGTNLKLTGFTNGDKMAYIIFKDIGA